jgi:hypothetical protein
VSEKYDHPVPIDVANRAARHYRVPSSQFHRILEEIDQMQHLRDELQQAASRTHKVEKVKYSLGVEYYRVGRGWNRRILTELDETPFNTSNALNQSYDRVVTDKTDTHIENGQGFVITDRS